VDEAFKVLSTDIFHRYEVSPFCFAKIIHSADIPVADFAGIPKLIREPFNGLSSRGNLRLQQLQGHFLVIRNSFFRCAG
jgi:hypothetical protein